MLSIKRIKHFLLWAIINICTAIAALYAAFGIIAIVLLIQQAIYY